MAGLFASPRYIRRASLETLVGDLTPQLDAFRRFYDLWFEHVARWTSALGAPEADRDDILQEVFLVVKRRLPAFDGRNPAGWLYRITRRQIRDFRNRAWVKHVFTRQRSDEPDAVASSTGHPEAVLERKQRHSLLGAILAKMNVDRRVAFVLFEIDGLSGDEISRIQGVPLNTVWARLRKARKEFFELAAKFRRTYGDDLPPQVRRK